MNKYKAMIILYGMLLTNKQIFVTVNPKNTCKFEFADHLWLPFIDQTQSDVVVFAIIYS